MAKAHSVSDEYTLVTVAYSRGAQYIFVKMNKSIVWKSTVSITTIFEGKITIL